MNRVYPSVLAILVLTQFTICPQPAYAAESVDIKDGQSLIVGRTAQKANSELASAADAKDAASPSSKNKIASKPKTASDKRHKKKIIVLISLLLLATAIAVPLAIAIPRHGHLRNNEWAQQTAYYYFVQQQNPPPPPPPPAPLVLVPD